jgi:hypothetical protein
MQLFYISCTDDPGKLGAAPFTNFVKGAVLFSRSSPRAEEKSESESVGNGNEKGARKPAPLNPKGAAP